MGELLHLADYILPGEGSAAVEKMDLSKETVVQRIEERFKFIEKENIRWSFFSPLGYPTVFFPLSQAMSPLWGNWFLGLSVRLVLQQKDRDEENVYCHMELLAFTEEGIEVQLFPDTDSEESPGAQRFRQILQEGGPVEVELILYINRKVFAKSPSYRASIPEKK